MSNAVMTHFMNSGNGRMLELDFTQNGNQVSATLPADSLRLMPGWYMLFGMVDDIPSVAQIVQVLPGKASVAVESPIAGSEILVFPNPTGREILVQLASEKGQNIQSVELVDVSGKVVRRWSGAVFSDNLGEVRLDLPEVPTGVYFLKIQANGRAVCRKVVLQN